MIIFVYYFATSSRGTGLAHRFDWMLGLARFNARKAAYAYYWGVSLKKVRGSYMVEMVLVAGVMALLATTALSTLTNALKDRQKCRCNIIKVCNSIIQIFDIWVLIQIDIFVDIVPMFLMFFVNMH